MQLENDKFCGNYPSRWSLKSRILSGMLNENLEIHGMEGNTFFQADVESKETKLWKKRWYVAHVLCIT